jgi:hypothetical protein
VGTLVQGGGGVEVKVEVEIGEMGAGGMEGGVEGRRTEGRGDILRKLGMGDGGSGCT